MKKLFGRLFCIMLCALALVCSAALAEPVFTMDYDGYITSVTMDSETQTLIIPSRVGGTDVRGIRAGVFSSYPELKSILLEVSQLRSFPNDALDLTSAPNLECIYLTADINNNRIPDVLMRNSDVDLLQYIDVSTKSISVDSISYENDKVSLAFMDIIPAGYYGYSYHITQTAQGSDESEEFNSAAALSNFSMRNGTVRFIDATVQPGQEYSYRIVVVDPFGRTCIPCETSISIPAAKPSESPLPPETGDATIVTPTVKPSESPLPPVNDGDASISIPIAEPLDPPPPPVNDGDASISIPIAEPLDPPPPPETGDGASIILWSAFLCISFMGIMLLCRRKEG